MKISMEVMPLEDTRNSKFQFHKIRKKKNETDAPSREMG
jgi:hypothetical protein